MTTIARIFVGGGFFMWPITIVSIMLFIASIRYAIDTEPIRLKFIAVLALLLTSLAFVGTSAAIIRFLGYSAGLPQAEYAANVMLGISETMNLPGWSGLWLVLSLIAIAIGVYRAGRRELKALKP